MPGLTRREFVKLGSGACLAIGAPSILGCGGDEEPIIASAEPHEATVHAILGDGLGDLYRMGGDAAQALGINAGRKLSGARVFIKPNLFISGMGFDAYMPETGMYTKSEILVGIAEQCLLAGADKVTIGEGAHGRSWEWTEMKFFEGNTVLQKRNLAEAVERLRATHPGQEVELLCLNAADEWEHIPSCSDHEIMQEGLMIARSYWEADHAISVPVMKTHMWSDVTCSMKNLVGVTPLKPPYATTSMRDRVHTAYASAKSGGFEKTGIAGCFTDICKWRKEARKEDFAIIDCSIGIEGNGPMLTPRAPNVVDTKERTPVGKYFLLASNDLAAADATAVRIMSRNVDDVKQLVLASRLGLGEIRNVGISGSTLDQLQISDFKWPETSVSEWGVAESPLPLSEESSGNAASRAINTLGGISIPAGMICFLRNMARGEPGRDRETDTELE
jgi:uncharacterized protein (DUF362 family)